MKIKQYKSGLRIVVNTNSNIDIVTFNMYVKTGSTNETKEQYGISHFLEHMFFKSNKHFTSKDLKVKFDDLGTRINAFTSFSRTNYYFKSLKNKFEESLYLYSTMFYNLEYDFNEVEKEKHVILEEYKMYLDDSDSRALDNAMANLYSDTVLGHAIIGVPETIGSFTAKDFVDYKNKYYIPENIVISISGNINFEEAENALKQYFPTLFKGEYDGEYLIKDTVKFNIKDKFFAYDKDVEQSIIYILYDMGKITEDERFILELYTTILGFGMSSKLFEIIRNQKGLVYSIYSSAPEIEKNALTEIYFSTSNIQVEEALKSISEILKDCADGNITQEELNTAKTKFISGMVYSNETNDGISRRNGVDLLMDNKIQPREYYIDKINSVTLEQIKDCAKKFYSNQNYVISSVGKCTKQNLEKFIH